MASAQATLRALGAGRLESDASAGAKHELLLARRAANQATEAFLKENETRSALRRVEVLRADADYAALDESERNVQR